MCAEQISQFKYVAKEYQKNLTETGWTGFVVGSGNKGRHFKYS